MRMPFEKLVRAIAAETDEQATIGSLARKYDVSTERIMDAIDTGKMLRGEITYIDVRG